MGEVAEFSKGSGYSKGDLVEYGTPIILYGRLYTNYETRISDVDTFVEAKVGSVYSKGGEVVVPASGETAEDIARAATVDKSGILLGGDLNIVMPNKDINSSFLAISISSGNPQRELAKKAQGKSVVHIHNEEIKNLVLPFPIKDEQNKIASYFCQLDNLITLHQRKYLQEKKTSLTWEQRKLSELASMHARIGWQNLRTSEFLDVGDYMLITGTDFEDGKVNYSTCHYVEKERYDQDKNIQIKNGSILITKDGTLGKVAYVEGLSMPATLNAGVFNVEIKNKNETDGRYLFQFLKAPFLMDYVAQKATGGTIKHLNQNILVDFPISSPSKEEQTKIGEYFSSIDHLITLHQSKCENLKNLKKYMLRNMFV